MKFLRLEGRCWIAAQCYTCGGDLKPADKISVIGIAIGGASLPTLVVGDG